MNNFVRLLPERFFLDLAIGTTPFAEICHTYDIDPDALTEHEEDPLFRQRLLQAHQVVEDDGVAFKARCRRVVSDAIPRMERIIHDDETPASAQLEAFKMLSKFAGFEPSTAATAAGSHLTLTIIAPGGQRLEANMGPALLEHDDEDEPMGWLERG